MIVSTSTTHVSNGFFWRSYRHRPSSFFSLLNVTCKWHHPLTARWFFYGRPIHINYWFFNDYRRECYRLNTRVCAISHSIAVVYICSSLKSTTHYHSSSRGRRESARVNAYIYIYAFQSNLNNLTYMEWERQNSCRHFIYVCLCVAMFVWTFFKCISARQRNHWRKKISITN